MNRSTILLIGLLLVLGAIALFLLPSTKEREASYESPEVNVSVDSASVVKIQLEHAGRSATLENSGGKWMLTAPVRYAADANAVKQVLSGMAKFKVGSLISSNPEKQGVFQVDTAGTKITFTERSGKSTSLILGKTGPSFTEIYFRLPASKDVYLGEGLDTWTISKEVKDWRDRTILETPSEAIKGLTYSVAGRDYVFQRDTSGWKSGGKPADGNLINPILSTLSNLRADDFIDTSIELKGRPAVLRLQGAEDVALNLYALPPDSMKYVVQTSRSPQMFTLGKWVARQLLKPTEQRMAAARQPEVTEAVTTPEEIEQKPAPRKETRPAIAKEQAKKVIPPPAVAAAPETARVVQRESLIQRRRKAKAAAQADTLAATENEPEKPPAVTKEPVKAAPAPAQTETNADEGDLTVYTVHQGETMQTIAKKHNVAVEQILKWNLLKSIAVRPGQELYIYVKPNK